MANLVSTSTIQPLEHNDSADRLPMVTVAQSPDSYSFQHHLDRVTHIIAQGSHLLRGNTSAPYAVTGRRGKATVQHLWQHLGYDSEHVLYSRREVKADTLVFSCRAILIHPWLSLKTLEFFGIDHNAVSTTRNKVCRDALILLAAD